MSGGLRITPDSIVMFLHECLSRRRQRTLRIFTIATRRENTGPAGSRNRMRPSSSVSTQVGGSSATPRSARTKPAAVELYAASQAAIAWRPVVAKAVYHPTHVGCRAP